MWNKIGIGIGNDFKLPLHIQNGIEMVLEYQDTNLIPRITCNHKSVFGSYLLVILNNLIKVSWASVS